jgi:hypothetical protein
MLTTYVLLGPRLRMSEVIHPLSLYTSMGCRFTTLSSLSVGVVADWECVNGA